jgi:AcrR family transcriptional regulator
MPTQRGSSSPRGRRAEERLLDALTAVAARHGYAHLTVQTLLLEADVSRATYYQYYANIDGCFRSAYLHHAEGLISDVRAAVAREDPPENAIADQLVALAISQPEVARLLMTEALAAGPLGVAERDTLIQRIAETVARSGPQRRVIDLPLGLMVGGTFRFLSMRLADGDVHPGLRDELRQWLSAFASRPSQPSWSAMFAAAPPGDTSRSSPTARTFRRTGTPRERVLKATAAMVREKGYRLVTVADIVAAAGVSRRSFYHEFPSKADACIAAYEHAFEHSLAACAPAFFSSRAWPERIWDSALAFTSYVAREPWFAHLGFVECYSVGRGFVARVHDTQLAFTLFLEEGYRQRPQSHRLSRSCAALTATTIFEAGFQGSRRGSSLYIRRLQPLAVYIALAPFIGLDEAGGFVAGKLSAGDSPPSSAA